MKLMPAPRAFAMIRVEVASSVGPPNIMVPRQIGEIFRPLRPRGRYCIARVLSHDRHSGAMRKHRTRNLEIPGMVLTHHPGMTESASSLGHPQCRQRYAWSLNILNTPLA